MYIDAMQQIYSNVTKVMVDSRQGSNLLYMPLDKIIQHVGAGGPWRQRRPSLMPRRCMRFHRFAGSTCCRQVLPTDARARDASPPTRPRHPLSRNP